MSRQLLASITRLRGDLLSDLEAGERVKVLFRMILLIQRLESADFWIFGGPEVQRVEGGIAAPSAFPVAILKALTPCASFLSPLFSIAAFMTFYGTLESSNEASITCKKNLHTTLLRKNNPEIVKIDASTRKKSADTAEKSSS